MASSSTSQRDYDVFLSFRGEDTRLNIVSHLYKALIDKGIHTFKDDKDLEVGDTIADELVNAIKNSLFAVVVLSENYATSRWCLDELAQIMELKRDKQIRVVPIFYNVEPSDVGHQTGSFNFSFHHYPDEEKKNEWIDALKRVSKVLGMHSRICVDEAAMVVDLVKRISRQLQMMKPTDDNLVGMEAHMVKMGHLLNMGSENEVCVLGIWGMEGIGKTTIAKCLYDRFSSQFSACCFIEDIKKINVANSPSYLQKKILSSINHGKNESHQITTSLGQQKVFLVLDGVDEAEKIRALLEYTTWFGSESRIIITTRDMGLLNFFGVTSIYEVKCLDNKDALQVFEKSVWGPPPTDGFERLFIRASQLAHGLPSALVAYASYLRKYKTIEQWEDEICSLETSPHENIEKILGNSYDDLNKLDMTTTSLSVACLFNGYPVSHVTSLLDDGRPRINHLIAKSLINISTDGRINMHFLVAQKGRSIVCQESGNRPSKQRFLWVPNDIYQVLGHNRGTDEIEGVTLHTCNMPDTLSMSDGIFTKMRNLEFLKFFQHLGDITSNVQGRPECLVFASKLRLLHWDACPLEILPYNFKHHHLVELNLRYSNLKRLWDETAILPKLRRLDVTGSNNLIELPDMSSALNFEELIIEGCMRLQNIPESIARSPNLTTLNAVQCDTLRVHLYFGNRRIHRGSLANILKLPNRTGQLSSLTDLSIEGQIYIDFFGLYGNVEHLSFGSKQQTTRTPRLISDFNSSTSLEIKQLNYTEYSPPFHSKSFEKFPLLTELKLINLNIEEIAEDIGDLQFLETLDLSGNDFTSLPNTMGQLPKLKHLSLQNCRKLKELPRLAQVERVTLSGCVNLRSLLGNFGLQTGPDINTLLELCLENCKSLQSLSHELSHFTNLTYLDLSSLEFETIPTSIREFPFITTLCLNKCNNLTLLENLPQSLNYLYAHGCTSLKYISFSPNHSIKHLDLSHCFSLYQEQEDLVSQFINQGHSKNVTHKFACVPGTNMPSYFDNLGPFTRRSLPPWIVPKLVEFVVYIMVSCVSSFPLKFPAFSYNWTCESQKRFQINLKPNFYRSPEIEEKEKDIRSHHLIIIQVPSVFDKDKVDELHFESHLQVPPGEAEISSCGVRLIVA